MQALSMQLPDAPGFMLFPARLLPALR